MFLTKTKKFFSCVLIGAFVFSFLPNFVSAGEIKVSIGNYFYLGNYLGEQILWRCVDEDENGPLILSDKIISIKPYDAAGTNTSGSHNRGFVLNNESGALRKTSGSNYWEDSNLRSWLNSEAPAGKVEWLCGNPPKADSVQNGQNAYDNEAGFLTNFSIAERNVIKTVSQKTLLDGYEFTVNINKNYHVYNRLISNVLQNYNTAYSRKVTDKMFLLDVRQANRVYENADILGANYYKAYPTEICIENSDYKEYLNGQNYWYYWLRTPKADSRSNEVRVISNGGQNQVYRYSAYANNIGVRPAFYLDKDADVIMTGSGTRNDPYVFANSMTGTCGENLIWTINRSKLTISGTGDMYNFSDSYSAPWSDFSDVIVSAEVCENVTSIGDNAFAGCMSLTDISLSDTVCTVGSNAFAGCTSLNNVSVGINNKKFFSDNGVLYTKDKETLILYPTGKTDTKYTLLESVKYISDNAFSELTLLTDLYYLGSEDKWANVSIGKNNDILNIITLHFTPIYTVRYDENGGESAPDEQTAIDGTSLILSTFIPKREGYNFIGWSTESDSETIQYTSGDTIDAVTSDMTLYAVWQIKMGMQVGDYLSMGNYLGEPILWRCIKSDDGTLTYISDKILCIKPFDAAGTNISGSHNRGYVQNNESGYFRKNYGSNYWEDSNLRSWLNSDASSGEVVWRCGNPPTKENILNGNNSYDKEAGFLTNFTPVERSTMKTLTRRTLLDGFEFTSSVNSNYHRYNALVSDVMQNYSTAYSRSVADTIFLPDVSDIYNMSITPELGEKYYRTAPTKACVENSEYTNNSLNPAHDWYYWLSTPYASSYSHHVRTVTFDKNNQVYRYPAYTDYVGVRPLFYFDSTSDIKLSGTGSLSNPYTVSERIHGICGDSLVWEVDNGILTISGSGEMYDYEGGTAPWYDYRNEITEVMISDGIESIGNYAFSDCILLTNITLPDSVKSVENNAFENCKRLSSVTFGSELCVVGGNAFDGCTALSDINVSEENHAYCSVDGILFSKNKTMLVYYGAGRENNEYTVPDTVTIIAENAFKNATKLSKITILDSLTGINKNAFSGCTGLIDVYYLGFESNWTKVSIADGNSCLTDAELHCIPPVQIYTVIYDANGGENAPDSQSAVENSAIILSEQIPVKENNIFLGWSRIADSKTAQYNAGGVIEAVTSDITLYAVWKEVIASGNCGVNLKWTLDQYGVLEITGTGKMYDYPVAGNAPWYQYKRKITDIVIGDGVENIGAYAFYSCNNIKTVSIEGNVRTIGAHAFQYCDVLKQITLPNSINKINECAFSDCISLTDIVLPMGVEFIGSNAFNGCRELTRITIPDSVTTLGNYAFNGCKKLSEITLSSNLTAIGDCIFYDCIALTNIDIPVGVTSIGTSAFRSCTSLRSINLPDSVKMIGDNAFEGCKSITSVDLGNNLEIIGELAFSGCTSLSDIILPESVSEIGGRAFARCMKITDINIPVTVKYIYGSTFSECTGLLSVTIPNSITYIGNSAFYGCTDLNDIYYNGSKEQWEQIEIDEDNECLNTAELHNIIPKIFNLEAIYTDNTVNISAAVQNIPSNAVIYIGIYDNNGKILDISSPVIEGDMIQLNYTFDDAYLIKAFLFEKQSLRPLLNPVPTAFVK